MAFPLSIVSLDNLDLTGTWTCAQINMVSIWHLYDIFRVRTSMKETVLVLLLTYFLWYMIFLFKL